MENLKVLKNIDKDIWIFEGKAVSFYTMPYTTRMTVIRINKNELWIQSPCELSIELIVELKQIGNVKYILSPNKIHHIYMQDWQEEFPNAKLYSSPGLEEKRKDIKFNSELKNNPEPEWEKEIKQMIFYGSSIMEEVIFLHKKSKTLILGDLIENFDENHFSGIKKIIAKWVGILAPNGKAPVDLRFTFNKKTAGESFNRMMEWNFEKIILSHGIWIKENGKEFAKKSFRWVKNN